MARRDGNTVCSSNCVWSNLKCSTTTSNYCLPSILVSGAQQKRTAEGNMLLPDVCWPLIPSASERDGDSWSTVVLIRTEQVQANPRICQKYLEKVNHVQLYVSIATSLLFHISIPCLHSITTTKDMLACSIKLSSLATFDIAQFEFDIQVKLLQTAFLLLECKDLIGWPSKSQAWHLSVKGWVSRVLFQYLKWNAYESLL